MFGFVFFVFVFFHKVLFSPLLVRVRIRRRNSTEVGVPPRCPGQPLAAGGRGWGWGGALMCAGPQRPTWAVKATAEKKKHSDAQLAG